MSLFRKRRRVPSDELGAQLARLVLQDVVEQPESLDVRVRATGFVPSGREAEYLTELIIVGLFPFDVIVALELGSPGDRVRERMREVLLDVVNSARTEWRQRLLTTTEWTDRVETRLAEYAQLLRERPSRPEWPLMAYSLAVAERLTGSRDIGVAMIASIKYAGVMKFMRDPIREFEPIP